MNEEKYPFEEKLAEFKAEADAAAEELAAASKAEAESNESTLIKAAKALQKAISMARIGNDRCKLGTLMRAFDACDDIVHYDERTIKTEAAQSECLRVKNYPLR